MRPLWFPNLKRFATGSSSGGKNAMDVNVINSITTAAGALAQKEFRFHLPATTNINARTGAWIQLDANSDVAGSTPADVANTGTAIALNWNGGAALQVGVGATSGAVTVLGTIGAGQTISAIGATLASGNKLWVRALQNAAITTGELLVAVLG